MSKYVREVDSIDGLRDTPTSDAAAAHVRTPTGQSGIFVPMDGDPFGNGDDGATALQARDGTWWTRRTALEGTFNARHFGAQKDRQGDAAPAIQSAIDTAAGFSSDRPATVRIPNGVYSIESGITLPDRVQLVGDGIENTILVGENNGLDLLSPQSPDENFCRIDGLGLWGAFGAVDSNARGLVLDGFRDLQIGAVRVRFCDRGVVFGRVFSGQARYVEAQGCNVGAEFIDGATNALSINYLSVPDNEEDGVLFDSAATVPGGKSLSIDLAYIEQGTESVFSMRGPAGPIIFNTLYAEGGGDEIFLDGAQDADLGRVSYTEGAPVIRLENCEGVSFSMESNGEFVTIPGKDTHTIEAITGNRRVDIGPVRQPFAPCYLSENLLLENITFDSTRRPRSADPSLSEDFTGVDVTTGSDWTYTGTATDVTVEASPFDGNQLVIDWGGFPRLNFTPSGAPIADGSYTAIWLLKYNNHSSDLEFLAGQGSDPAPIRTDGGARVKAPLPDNGLLGEWLVVAVPFESPNDGEAVENISIRCRESNTSNEAIIDAMTLVPGTVWVGDLWPYELA
jgi:hypothetical protein